jgi:hypothetical protein
VTHRLETQMLFLLELPLLVLVRLYLTMSLRILTIILYATTYKTVLSRGNNASSSVTAYSALWRSTSAINEIKVSHTFRKFKSWLNLYPIRNRGGIMANTYTLIEAQDFRLICCKCYILKYSCNLY